MGTLLNGRERRISLRQDYTFTCRKRRPMKTTCAPAWQADDADFAFQMQRSRLDQATPEQLACLGDARVKRGRDLGRREEADISRHQARPKIAIGLQLVSRASDNCRVLRQID